MITAIAIKNNKPEVLPKQEIKIIVTEESIPKYVAPVKVVPDNFTITTVIPDYKNYEETVKQLKTWESEAKDLVEVGIYGKSTKNKDLYYLKIKNKLDNKPKPKVLISGCIHGNESHSSSVVMSYVGTLLDQYNKDNKIKNILLNREVYFIPVVSPDSYPQTRHVDGVDPNRNFGKDPSVTPIEALKKFHEKEKFNAYISGHTFGRVYLIPPGNTDTKTANHEDYISIVGTMAKLSNYKIIRAYDLYQRVVLNNPPIEYSTEYDEKIYTALLPIIGSEVDWFYSHKCFSIVCEFGTHQRIPTYNEIKEESARTWEGMLVFLDQAPVVKID